MTSGLKMRDEAREAARAAALARGVFIVDRRLTLTRDGRVVDEGTESGWLFAIPGHEIPLEQAQRYGLVEARPAPVVAETPATAVSTSPEVPAPAARRRGRAST